MSSWEAVYLSLNQPNYKTMPKEKIAILSQTEDGEYHAEEKQKPENSITAFDIKTIYQWGVDMKVRFELREKQTV